MNEERERERENGSGGIKGKSETVEGLTREAGVLGESGGARFGKMLENLSQDLEVVASSRRTSVRMNGANSMNIAREL